MNQKIKDPSSEWPFPITKTEATTFRTESHNLLDLEYILDLEENNRRLRGWLNQAIYILEYEGIPVPNELYNHG